MVLVRLLYLASPFMITTLQNVFLTLMKILLLLWKIRWKYFCKLFFMLEYHFVKACQFFSEWIVSKCWEEWIRRCQWVEGENALGCFSRSCQVLVEQLMIGFMETLECARNREWCQWTTLVFLSGLLLQCSLLPWGETQLVGHWAELLQLATRGNIYIVLVKERF